MEITRHHHKENAINGFLKMLNRSMLKKNSLPDLKRFSPLNVHFFVSQLHAKYVHLGLLKKQNSAFVFVTFFLWRKSDLHLINNHFSALINVWSILEKHNRDNVSFTGVFQPPVRTSYMPSGQKKRKDLLSNEMIKKSRFSHYYRLPSVSAIGFTIGSNRIKDIGLGRQLSYFFQIYDRMTSSVHAGREKFLKQKSSDTAFNYQTAPSPFINNMISSKEIVAGKKQEKYVVRQLPIFLKHLNTNPSSSQFSQQKFHNMTLALMNDSWNYGLKEKFLYSSFRGLIAIPDLFDSVPTLIHHQDKPKILKAIEHYLKVIDFNDQKINSKKYLKEKRELRQHYFHLNSLFGFSDTDIIYNIKDGYQLKHHNVPLKSFMQQPVKHLLLNILRKKYYGSSQLIPFHSPRKGEQYRDVRSITHTTRPMDVSEYGNLSLIYKDPEPALLPNEKRIFAIKDMGYAPGKNIHATIDRKQTIEIVQKEVKTKVDAISLMKTMSTRDFQKISDNVYTLLKKRLVMEKERSALLH